VVQKPDQAKMLAIAYLKKKAMVVPTCEPSYMVSRGRRIISVRLIPGKRMRPYLKSKLKQKELAAWFKW
jgi:hypothetical protein